MPETLLLCGEMCRVTDACAGGVKCGLCPLSRFYSAAGRVLPDILEVPASGIPELQRRLLAHDRDMTSTLENYHGCRTHLCVLHQSTFNNVHHREVLLALNGSNRPVVFGAIIIQLSMLSEVVQGEILRACRPLGGLLNDFGVQYVSRPKAFIQVAADGAVAEALELEHPGILYGRCNALLTPDERVLADIVEILPL